MKKILLFLLFLTGLVGVSSSQDPDVPPTFRTNVDVVNILCTVRQGDRYVEGLSRDDFEVYEEGARQEIEFFSRESGEDAQPLNVVLLVDTSGSVRNKLDFEQAAASAFFNKVLRKNKDLAAIVQFDSEIALVQDFTYDTDLLDTSIQEIRAGGTTKLYDAIWVAVQDLLRHEVGRRVLVVLSDGEDTASSIADEQAIRVAQDHDVIIFGIGVKSRRYNSNFGKLEKFAQSTGGLFFNSKARISELTKAFDQINSAIKNQYSIGYVSNQKDRKDEFREIEVKVKGRGLKVHHRRGYYAQKPQS